MFRPLTARVAALAVVPVLTLAACSNDGDPAAVQTTTESPTPSPTPTYSIKPVVGERTATVFPLGSGPVLGLGANAEPDQAAIDAAVAAVGDWLDAHLDQLQRGEDGQWDAMAADGLAEDDQRAPVTTELASPDAPVESARYVMSVYHAGPPQYLTTRVQVTHPDDSTSDVGLVFTVAEDGTPTLTMFGPEPAPEAEG